MLSDLSLGYRSLKQGLCQLFQGHNAPFERISMLYERQKKETPLDHSGVSMFFLNFQDYKVC